MAVNKNLTKKEEHVLNLLTNSKNPIKDTTSRLNISRNMVYKYIYKLREKQAIKGSSYLGFTKAMLSPKVSQKGFTNKPLIRLHGQEFHITLNHDTKHTRKVIRYKGSTIIIYRRSIRVFALNNEFQAYSASECIKESFLFWDLFFLRLEDRFKISFYKEGRDNIEMVNAHFEEYNSETGQWIKKQGVKRLQVRGTNDGIVWAEYDLSKKGKYNFEVKHPKTAFNDAEMLFDDALNSWRDGTAYLPKQSTHMIGKLAEDRLYHAENIKSHIQSIKTMARVLDELKSEVKKLSKRNN